MSTIQTDFDRIALVSDDGATHNDHYHSFLLRHAPSNCDLALEIGCGTGGFARRLAERTQQVLAFDLSPEMIRIARERSAEFPNIEFELADVRNRTLPEECFDCVASIATLHHLPFREMLLKMKATLRPGGVLLVLDLFEPIKWHGHPARDLDGSTRALREGLLDTFLNLLAIPVSVTLRLIHQGRLLPSREVRDAWAAHEAHDVYPTMTAVRDLCADILPGAKVRKHLLWRYSIVWQKPDRHDLQD
jgi:ubiquinone/menaquinone biosynthesis C-methylase UbiE